MSIDLQLNYMTEQIKLSYQIRKFFQILQTVIFQTIQS